MKYRGRQRIDYPSASHAIGPFASSALPPFVLEPLLMCSSEVESDSDLTSSQKSAKVVHHEKLASPKVKQVQS